MTHSVQIILAELRQYLELVYQDRLSQVILFGSQARTDADPSSDIDVLIVLEGLVDASEEIARIGHFTADLSLRYDTVVSCVFVSVERYQQEKSPFLLNVHREGIAV